MRQHAEIWRVGTPAKLPSKVKESERRPFIFIFRLNVVLHDSYQADEIVIKIEEWKQKFSGDVKSFSRV